MPESNKRANGLSSTAGFTLIELLTTVAIIGILSGIASQQFHSYSLRALDSRAESDVHQLVTAEEAYYAQAEEYVSCTNAACNSTLPAFLLSVDTQMEVVTREDNQEFAASAFHPMGKKVTSFDTDGGKFTSTPRP